MKSMVAFMKKEIIDQLRSGKLLILMMVFVAFGIMNPMVAKLTPLLLEAMADALAESGMIVTKVEISAMDSWVQFFKNLPMGLIVFVLIESSIFTKEYSSGTLILSLTKGLERYKVLVSKSVALVALWTVCYFICFGITYGCNSFLWDNSVAQNLFASVVIWWLFGILVISLIVLFSVLTKSNVGVLLSLGGVIFIFSLVGMLPKINKYLPTFLSDGNSLIYGVNEISEYIPSIVISLALIIACFVISVPIFNKKQL